MEIIVNVSSCDRRGVKFERTLVSDRAPIAADMQTITEEEKKREKE